MLVGASVRLLRRVARVCRLQTSTRENWDEDHCTRASLPGSKGNKCSADDAASGFFFARRSWNVVCFCDHGVSSAKMMKWRVQKKRARREANRASKNDTSNGEE